MSEQTPNSSEDLSGAEPSMEDILASIRKIISDDEPVAMESPEDIPAVSIVEADTPDHLDDLMQGFQPDSDDLTSDAVLDVSDVLPEPPMSDGDSVDLNIEDVLAGLDEDILSVETDQPSITDPTLAPSESDETVFAALDSLDEPLASSVESLNPTPELIHSDGDIPETDDDILAFLDEEIPLVSEPVVPLTDIDLTATEAEPDKIVGGDDIEMDALLDDILMTPLEDDGVKIPDDTSVETASFEEGSVTEEQSDLDLVKSLMADLADDPGEIETDEELEALLAIPEVEDTPETEPDIEAAAESEPEEDILGDILNMTLEDELQSHPEDVVSEDDIDLTSLDAVLEAEQDNITENAVPLEETPIEEVASEEPADDFPSLSDIAAAAEADAVAVETSQTSPVLAATAGLGAVAGLAALGTKTSDETLVEAEPEPAEIYSEPTPEPILTTQETSMPVKAVKTDAILDEVTETATAGAFAELNQVVEDKAIFNERGPRIGDLVQEALRPMLKEWLDANLKGIVERAVTKEVKRISSGK